MSHHSCPIKFKTWINPLSQDSLTPITEEEMNGFLDWINDVYEGMVNETIIVSQGKVKSTDFIHPSVFISSIFDLFLGFMTRHKVPHEDYLCLLLSTYKFMINIYDETMIYYPSKLYQYLINNVCLDLSYQKYYHQIVKFVEYDPYSYPLTINYVTHSNECLHINCLEDNGLIDIFYYHLYDRSLEPSSYQNSPLYRIIVSLNESI